MSIVPEGEELVTLIEVKFDPIFRLANCTVLPIPVVLPRQGPEGGHLWVIAVQTLAAVQY